MNRYKITNKTTGESFIGTTSEIANILQCDKTIVYKYALPKTDHHYYRHKEYDVVKLKNYIKVFKLVGVYETIVDAAKSNDVDPYNATNFIKYHDGVMDNLVFKRELQ